MAMVLKYPQTITLPSIPRLKAKLAWFGPLVEGGTCLCWTSYTCQVIFQLKPDAQTAAMYVNNNEHLLGRNVRCSLFEVDPATLEPLLNPGKPRPPASSPKVGPPARPGKDGAGSGGSLTPPRALPHRQPPAPTALLKSILKKPGSISASRPPSSLPPQPPTPPLPLLLHSSLSTSLLLHSSSHNLLHLHLHRHRFRSIPLSHHLLQLHLHCRACCHSIPLSHHLLYLHLRRCRSIPPLITDSTSTSTAPFLSLVTYSNSTSAATAAAPFLSLISSTPPLPLHSSLSSPTPPPPPPLHSSLSSPTPPLPFHSSHYNKK